MSTNSNPDYGSIAAAAQARPWEFEAIIQRHGQLARIIQARKCPCITMGKAKIGCPLCHSKGYRLSFQRDLLVADEASRHCSDCPDGGTAMVYPWWTPIMEVRKVTRYLAPIQGGNTEYPVLLFDNSSIKIDTTGAPLMDYHLLKVTYKYSVLTEIIGEDSLHDGSFTVRTTGTEYRRQDRSNIFDIHGDIARVTRVRNMTQAFDYTVTGFVKRSIYLDPGTIALPAPSPLPSDVLEVDYCYVTPARVAAGRIEHEYALQKWGEDIKEGDLEALVPGAYNIGRGDLITLLGTMVKGQDVVIRGVQSYDELPQFDVYEILDLIEDEDGNTYEAGEFELREYNNLAWPGPRKPAAGKRYSVMYNFRPTYQVYKRAAGQGNPEDKIFPKNAYLRMANRLTVQDLEVQGMAERGT